METLPLEILLQIGSDDYHVWRRMLVVRIFAEYTLTQNCRSYVLRVFAGKGKNKSESTTLCGELHSYFDQPAQILKENKSWYCRGLRHRDNDLPAIISADGMLQWRQYGKLHRGLDLPAIIDSDGSKEWYRAGEVHRDGDLPAKIFSYGSQEWFHNGKRHRENDLPAIIDSDGTRIWYYCGLLHRDHDLPAVIYPHGIKKWYHEGKLLPRPINTSQR